MKNRHIGKSERLLSNIIQTAKLDNLEGFLVVMDIEKAFDSLDDTFISFLKKYGFGQNFISWIKTLLKNQEYCIINRRKTATYFRLERGTREGDPISAYLFILALKILFLLLKTNSNIKGFKIFDHCYFYSAYTDYTIPFVKHVQPIENMIHDFHIYSTFSGLKPNLMKCKMAGIGVINGVKEAVCGM